jgi:acetylornithine deacetylase/succinyl-diaminopimelate desuccinylase-like protein
MNPGAPVVGFKQRRALRRMGAAIGAVGSLARDANGAGTPGVVARGATAATHVSLAARLAEPALAYCRGRQGRFVNELAEFIRFPTVSAQPWHARDMIRCATWLADRLQAIGLDHVQIARTGGHPIVTADWLRALGEPTLLIYGHYDVQPPDPLGEWDSPPFQPSIRGQRLYGRGASDNKGQLFVHVKALESYLQSSGSLPVNVRCLFEGEEEIGSPHLPRFLSTLSACAFDTAILSDMPMLGPSRPAITESLRGALSVELEVTGQKSDLHSGNFGGAVQNPLQALWDIIARLHDARGAIAIRHFYDHVRELSREERAYMGRVGPTDQTILHDPGAHCRWGERSFSLYEQTTIRPGLSVNGLSAGYQGPGAKAVIPASAVAKLDFRLVPDQDPVQVEALFRDHVQRIAPPCVRVGVRTQFSAHPFVLLRNAPAVRAAVAACRKGFGVPPVFRRIGGTIPVAHLLHANLGVSSVLMGFALPDDRPHAPNERFFLPNFFRGIETSIHFLAELRNSTGYRLQPS